MCVCVWGGQALGTCWLVGTGEQQTRAFNPQRGGEGEVTLMKLVAYENGVMPFGSGVTSDFINLFFFSFFLSWPLRDLV